MVLGIQAKAKTLSESSYQRRSDACLALIRRFYATMRRVAAQEDGETSPLHVGKFKLSQIANMDQTPLRTNSIQIPAFETHSFQCYILVQWLVQS